MTTMLPAFRVARVTGWHQVRQVVIRRLPVEMIDVKTAGHRPTPVHPLFTPIAAVRAEPDGVEQHKPVLRDQSARSRQHMFRGVHRTAPTVVYHDMPGSALFAALPDIEVPVAFDPGVMPAAKALSQVRIGAPVHSAKPRLRSCLFKSERMTGLLPAGVVQRAEPPPDDVACALVHGAYRRSRCFLPSVRKPWGAFSTPAAVVHGAPPPRSRCSQTPVDGAVPSHSPSVAPCADWPRIGVDNSLQ